MAFKFEDLKVWDEAMKFASEVYTLTKGFPKAEQFGLISQLNRAAVSISLNIAEGGGRQSDPEYTRFVQISIGSLNEVVTLLYIALEQKYMDKAKFSSYYEKAERLSKMLHAFRNYLKLKKSYRL